MNVGAWLIVAGICLIFIGASEVMRPEPRYLSGVNTMTWSTSGTTIDYGPVPEGFHGAFIGAGTVPINGFASTSAGNLLVVSTGKEIASKSADGRYWRVDNGTRTEITQTEFDQIVIWVRANSTPNP